MHAVRVCLFCFVFSLGRRRRLGAPLQRELEAKKRDAHRAPLRQRQLKHGQQVATGAGKAFPHGTGAGDSLRMAYQEATSADKAFAHRTGAGSRSHLGAGARLSRTAQAREVARTWPTRSRRARARLSRTARAREVARTWQSFEMACDTVTVY